MPSTIPLLSLASTRMMTPRLARSLPERTSTSSPFFSFIAGTSQGTREASEHLRGERNDAHEALVPQLATDGPEDAGAPRLLLVVDQHGGVLVEADVAAVGAALLFLRAYHHALDHVAFLDVGAGDGVLDGGH